MATKEQIKTQSIVIAVFVILIIIVITGLFINYRNPTLFPGIASSTMNTFRSISSYETFPKVAFFTIILIIILTIVLFQVFPNSASINTPPPASPNEKKNGDTALLVIVLLVVFMGIIVYFFPSFESIRISIYYLSGLGTIVIYLIFLIVLFNAILPRNILDRYSKIILPVTMVPGFWLFYKQIMDKALAENSNINSINFTRTKYTLLYFCFIVFLLIFYNIDPGQYVTQYFGPNLIVTILLLLFGFLYLLVLFIPEKYLYSPGQPSTSTPPKESNFFKGFSWFGLFNAFSFVFFLVLLTYGIINYKSDDTNARNSIIFGTLIVFLIWVPLLIYSLYPAIRGHDDTTAEGIYESARTNMKTLIQRAALIIFGVIISCLLIYLIVTSSASLTSTSGIGSFILNLIIVIACLGILFKIIASTEAYQKSRYFKLIVNMIFYVPCLLVNTVDYLVDLTGRPLPFSIAMPHTGKLSLDKTKAVLSSGYNASKNTVLSGVSNIANTSASYIALLLIILSAYAVYFGWPYISDYFAKQGGLLLINQPVYLNEEHVLGTYQDMNKSVDFDYTYGISFWFYLDDNKNVRQLPILNFGGKPNVLYDGSGNTLMVTMLNTTGIPVPPTSDQYDSDGNFIVCTIPNILLQKWNNMIINYSNGTLDIFYNGTLLKSFRNAVAEMTYDALVSGAKNGIQGGICNVNYFNKNLSSTQIYSLYHLVKDKTPPVTLSDDTTIQQINTYIAPVKSKSESVWSKIETGTKDTLSNTKDKLSGANTSSSDTIKTKLSDFFLKN